MTIAEGDETFTVTIDETSLPSGILLGTGTATGTIADDDRATVSIADARADEGAPVEFTVRLSTQASSDVVLNWSTADETAMSPGDYTAVSSRAVTIAAGETTARFMVATRDEAIAEDDETFEVTLVASGPLPAGVGLGSDHATGTIINDDNATLSIAGDANATEGAPVEFRVNLSTAADEAVVLNWTGAGGTAIAGTDYTASGTVTIAAGEITNTFRMATVNDALAEGDETFTLTIAADGALPAGVTLGTATATGTIIDDDSATVSVANARGNEGAPVEFTVSLTAAVSSDVVLNWSTADGTARASGDYTATSNGTVTIAAGATTNTFRVATADDALTEADETFTGHHSRHAAGRCDPRDRYGDRHDHR